MFLAPALARIRPNRITTEKIALRCACCWARRGVSHVPCSNGYELRKAQAKRNLSHSGRNHCTVHFKGFSSDMFVCNGHCGASSTREAHSDFQLYVSRQSCHGRCLVLSRPRPDRRQVPPNGNLHVRSAGNAENLKHRALVTVDVSVFFLTP